MPADAGPAETGFHALGGVELKGNDGGAASGRHADDFEAVVAPAKVRPPVVAARIEKWNELLRNWIQTVNLIGLEAVADAAGQPQILTDSEAAARPRNEVLEFERRIEQVLLDQTIATAVAGSLNDELPERGGNIVAAHGER